MVDQLDDPAVLSINDTVDDLRSGLFPYLSRSADRSNKILPKDGSELTDQLAYSSKTLPQITQAHANYDIGKDNGVLRIFSDAFRVILGVANGGDNDLGGGRVVHFLNVGEFGLRFAHNHIFAPTGSKMLLPERLPFTLVAGDGFTMHYDNLFKFWRFV